MAWRVRPPSVRPSERNRHRCALKRVRLRGATNYRPSSSSSSWRDKHADRLRVMYITVAGVQRVRSSQCDFLAMWFFHQWSCTIVEQGLPQENYLRFVLRLRCGFCQITLTSCNINGVLQYRWICWSDCQWTCSPDNLKLKYMYWVINLSLILTFESLTVFITCHAGIMYDISFLLTQINVCLLNLIQWSYKGKLLHAPVKFYSCSSKTRVL